MTRNMLSELFSAIGSGIEHQAAHSEQNRDIIIALACGAYSASDYFRDNPLIQRLTSHCGTTHSEIFGDKWYCTRDKGHEGPCALHEIGEVEREHLK